MGGAARAAARRGADGTGAGEGSHDTGRRLEAQRRHRRGVLTGSADHAPLGQLDRGGRLPRAGRPAAARGCRWSALAVLGGLAVGVSLAFLAGARRTASAYERHLDASRASHVEINPGQYTPESDAAIRALPGVEDISMWVAAHAWCGSTTRVDPCPAARTR